MEPFAALKEQGRGFVQSIFFLPVDLPAYFKSRIGGLFALVVAVVQALLPDIDELRDIAIVMQNLSVATVSSDPYDNYSPDARGQRRTDLCGSAQPCMGRSLYLERLMHGGWETTSEGLA